MSISFSWSKDCIWLYELVFEVLTKLLSEYSWLATPVSPFISKLKLGPEIYSKSLGTVNVVGKVTW